MGPGGQLCGPPEVAEVWGRKHISLAVAPAGVVGGGVIIITIIYLDAVSEFVQQII